ncbi:MAG: hypothetical protein WAN93_00585 [Solirubrobacteraceae bacterium]
MSAIQVKDVPADLHERLRARARSNRQSVGGYVLGLIEHDLALPTTREWLAQVKQGKPVTGVSRERILELIHQGRDERDEQIRAAISRH